MMVGQLRDSFAAGFSGQLNTECPATG